MTNSKRLHLNTGAYYLATFLLITASALPHAVLTVILLAKGLSLSQIMLVQAGYSLAILLSEYPSGLIADVFSKKKVFLVSKLFLILMFLIVIYAHSFLVIFLAWFFYGISSALDSGTIDVQLINDLKTSNQPQQVNRFIKYDNQLSFIALLVGSTVGSTLYYWLGINFYLCAVLLTILAMLIIWLGYKQVGQPQPHSEVRVGVLSAMQTSARAGFTELGKSNDLRLMIALTFVNQFFFQTHYQLWQALFLAKSLNQQTFFIYYIVFQFISIAAYSVPIKPHHVKILPLIFILLLGFAALLWGLSAQPIAIFLACYLILVFVFTVFDYISQLLFSKRVSLAHIASLTSFKSSCGRVASLLSLCISSLLLKLTSVQTVVLINFIVAVSLSFLVFGSVWLSRSRQSH